MDQEQTQPLLDKNKAAYVYQVLVHLCFELNFIKIEGLN